MPQSQWLAIPQPNLNASVRLLCISNINEQSGAFTRWPQHLPLSVEVGTIQFPGIGARLKEPPFRSMPQLIEALAHALASFLDKPFAIFGHGLGALIGFELTRHLRKHTGPQPKHLFVSGQRAPQNLRVSAVTYNLPDADFIATLRQAQNIPPEVLNHPELLQLILPTQRANVQLAETYTCEAGSPLAIPITACGGESDTHVRREDLEAWRDQTTAAFDVRMVPGDERFLHSAQGLLSHLVLPAIISA